VKSIEHVVVLKRTGGKIDWQEGRDLWWSDLIEASRPAPAGRDERGRSAVHPLYLRFNR
jgi:acetyl-CoA synthetase